MWSFLPQIKDNINNTDKSTCFWVVKAVPLPPDQPSVPPFNQDWKRKEHHGALLTSLHPSGPHPSVLHTCHLPYLTAVGPLQLCFSNRTTCVSATISWFCMMGSCAGDAFACSSRYQTFLPGGPPKPPKPGVDLMNVEVFIAQLQMSRASCASVIRFY